MKQIYTIVAGSVAVIGALHSEPAQAGYGWDGGWGFAEPVTEVNTEYGEGCPVETPDGLSLLIASTRADGATLDIWAADRESISAPWSAPEPLPAPVTSSSNDFCPLAEGRLLLFVSDRPMAGACGSGDIYMSRQSPAGQWTEPVNLGCAPDGPNTAGPERSPSLVEAHGKTYLFYSTNGGAGDHDIYVSRAGKGGDFGAGRVVRSLSSPSDDFMPNVRPLGKRGFEVVFNSNRPTWGPWNLGAYGGQDVYRSAAWHPLGHWLSPVNLGEAVNTGGDETRATMSGDGRRLHFGRDGDIYVSRR